MNSKTYYLIPVCTVIALCILLSACQTDSTAQRENPDTSVTIVPTETTEEVEAPAVVLETDSAEHEGPLVLYNGTLVTATGADPIPGAAIVVEDGRIVAVGPEAEITFPDDAMVVDVEGRTILPGLIDARASTLLHRLDVDEEGQINNVAVEIYLRNALKGGITTVRADGLGWEELSRLAGLKPALAELENTVPTIVFVGTSLAHPEGSAADTYADYVVGVATDVEARQATEQLVEFGVDQISYLLSITQQSHLEDRSDLPPVLSLEQLQAIVEEAHSKGLWVGGQAVFPEEAALSLEAGVDLLLAWPSRAEPMPEDLLQTLVNRSVPVVSGFNITPPQEGDVRRFLDAGGTLVYGTYAPNSGPLDEPYREFQVMALNGMTPMEMIRSATAIAAQAVGLGDELGTLEVGKQADIIVVDGDPFADFRAMRRVVYVVKGGDLVVRPEAERP